jgi:hypothetical protein
MDAMDRSIFFETLHPHGFWLKRDHIDLSIYTGSSTHYESVPTTSGHLQSVRIDPVFNEMIRFHRWNWKMDQASSSSHSHSLCVKQCHPLHAHRMTHTHQLLGWHALSDAQWLPNNSIHIGYSLVVGTDIEQYEYSFSCFPMLSFLLYSLPLVWTPPHPFSITSITSYYLDGRMRYADGYSEAWTTFCFLLVTLHPSEPSAIPRCSSLSRISAIRAPKWVLDAKYQLFMRSS